jgi:hypothetical protein
MNPVVDATLSVCGDAVPPKGFDVVVVVLGPARLTEAMSRFGQKRVPDEKRIPLPDWYRKAFLDWRITVEP